MKRKITELEQKLLDNGWCLAIKRYTGKHSEKTHCYEYHKTSDITNNGKSYEQVIQLDQKRSQIVNYGIANIQIDYLDDDELMLIRFLFFELKKYVQSLGVVVKGWICTKLTEERGAIIPINVPNSELDEKQELPPMTPEQFDELCQETEKTNAKGS